MKKITIVLLIVFLFQQSFAQLNITEIGSLPYSVHVSDVWGYVDNTNKEYAIVGLQDGVSVVDISTPSSPTEIHFEAGTSSNWRDIKTWNNYAYVTTEGGGGLLILDLSSLPQNPNLSATYYGGSTYPFTSAHNLYIDENGVAYIFGSDYSNGGAIMLDLSTPAQPVELGVFDDYYIHDGMVRGDTLWASHILDGFQSVIDVSDKTAPNMLASWTTPLNFTHNCWISDDGNYLFTTDERQFAYIAAYDVSDLGNVNEIDRWQANPGSGAVPHNTHFMNNYIITSYYNEGVNIVDVSHPDNMVEVGYFDTSPNFSGNDAGGFNGCWGAYPWLPSGLLLASDSEEGLKVLSPTYVRASRLEGTVIDSVCGESLNGVTIEILVDGAQTTSGLIGDFAFGTPASGTYDVQFSKSGYQTKTVTGVVLTNGQITNLDVQLEGISTVSIQGEISSANGMIENALVKITNPSYDYTFSTDGGGAFSKCNLPQGFYDVTIAKWGYVTQCYQNVSITANSSILNYTLEEGYHDDFSLDLGWIESGTANSGRWERGDPNGTIFGVQANPENDATTQDCDNSAYVTGNDGGNYWEDDIDDGVTELYSPIFDLTGYAEPLIRFYTWFFNDGGNDTPNDYLKVFVISGVDTTEILNIDNSNVVAGWTQHAFMVEEYTTLTNQMQLLVKTEDVPDGHIVESGFDLFEIISCDIEVTDSITNSFCNQSSGNIQVFPVSSFSPFSYQWSTGDNTNSVANLGAGTYTVSINDAAGCYLSKTFTVDNFDGPQVDDIDISGLTCSEDSIAQATISVSGGLPPYQYQWNSAFSAQTNDVITGLPVGTYVLTITDQSGCDGNGVLEILAIEPLDINFIIDDANGVGDVTIEAIGEGGTAPYSYSWSSGEVNPLIDNLTSGTFSLTITDSNGCEYHESITIVDQVTGIADLVESTEEIMNVYPNPFTNSLNVQLNLASQEKEILLTISDPVGRIIDKKRIEGNTQELHFKVNNKGVFFLSLFSDHNLIQVVKVIKQ